MAKLKFFKSKKYGEYIYKCCDCGEYLPQSYLDTIPEINCRSCGAFFTSQDICDAKNEYVENLEMMQKKYSEMTKEIIDVLELKKKEYTMLGTSFSHAGGTTITDERAFGIGTGLDMSINIIKKIMKLFTGEETNEISNQRMPEMRQ